ncbi:hypothetical protein PPROV_000409400 [Pycnococcus provasolii]|uniref:Uncharacterized protein n=1 Tax=Pycnococcus provasolii TaxID=41880 RepID=A0A830HF38_9CHLO|nr:hypothetical protein PPROV_000409400 [Pycnococcus provasolii]
MRVAWTLCAPSASPAFTKVAQRCLLAPTTTHDARKHVAAMWRGKKGETVEITLDSSAYRRDSRLEILVRQRGGCGDDDDDNDDGRQDETSLPALDMLKEDDSIALTPGGARDALLRHDWIALVASARSCVRL